MPKQTLLLGAHTSIAGGFEKAVERAESIQCTALQIFTKNNRQWGAKKITDAQAQLFRTTLKNSSIKKVIAHATYLINIGSPDAAMRKKSINGLIRELERCAQLGIPALIIHPGAHLKAGEEEGLERVAESLNVVLANTTSTTHILLETMAGQGSNLCYQFEHIAYLIKKSKFKRRLGVCFDTCHAFAAGYDFRTPATYKKMWNAFDKIIGLNKLKAIHLNDSKKELGSRVDRHEHVGKGKLGTSAFKLLFNDPRFFAIPKILETPKKEGLAAYARNMAVIKKLLSPATKKKLVIL